MAINKKVVKELDFINLKSPQQVRALKKIAMKKIVESNTTIISNI